MQACNVLYQPHLYIFFYFWCRYPHLSLTATFHYSLKTRMKIVKNACPKIVCWSGVTEKGKGGGGGGERHGCWGIDAPV